MGNSNKKHEFLETCPVGSMLVRRDPEEIQRLRRFGAVQTAGSPFMSMSHEIIGTDGRNPAFKCIESYKEYIPSENFHDKNAMNN